MVNCRNLALIIFALFLMFFLLGCTSPFAKPCEKTTDCGIYEVCQNKTCTQLDCRHENETCDSSQDCCNGFKCEKSMCRPLHCPVSCDDNNSCTIDSCDVESEKCTNQPISLCCGNGQCESGEGCGSCTADCGCGAGLVCEQKACVDDIMHQLEMIRNNASVETCRQEILNSYKLGNFQSVVNKSEKCSVSFSSSLAGIEKMLQKNGLSSVQKNSITAEYLIMDSKIEEIYFLQEISNVSIKKSTLSPEQYDNLQYLKDLKAALSHQEKGLYDLYLINANDDYNWSSSHDVLLKEYSANYQGQNQQINSLYDVLGNYSYKYAFQVDPEDPVVVDIVNGVNAQRNETDITLALLRYVYYSVDYVPDPDWQTDWVQPPAYTMMMGQGDCDDSAVLLASLFYRAGVDGTQLCFVDSDYDWKMDHLTVQAKDSYGNFLIYESVWDPAYYQAPYGDTSNKTYLPQPIKRFDYPGNILSCFKAEDVVSYALAKKCSDGTPYSQCSEDKPWYCSDKGVLESDCSRCGCPNSYPNCATAGDSIGDCINCPSGYMWLSNYGVCCKNGYDHYNPETGMCSNH